MSNNQVSTPPSLSVKADKFNAGKPFKIATERFKDYHYRFDPERYQIVFNDVNVVCEVFEVGAYSVKVRHDFLGNTNIHYMRFENVIFEEVQG